MEDKVLWIALKLFLVWLFVMAFCLCICNCLFIRSDKRKSKEAKISTGTARSALDTHTKLSSSEQCCDCEDDEEKQKFLCGENSPFIHDPHHYHHSHQLSPEAMSDASMYNHLQLKGQLSPGLLAHRAYIQRASTPKFTLQQPSLDDVNRSQLSFLQDETPVFIDVGPHGTASSSKPRRKRKKHQVTSDVLLNLLRTPSGKYLLFGKEERFRIETQSNPALNALEKCPAPYRVPLKNNKVKRQLPPQIPDEESHSCDGENSSSNSSSSSSMAIPPPPAFVITGDETPERPRSSSFSGRNSFRSAAPYRIRLTPSPTPSSFGSNQHSPALPSSHTNNDNISSTSPTSHVTVDIATFQDQLDTAIPSSTTINNNEDPNVPLTQVNTQSIVSDV